MRGEGVGSAWACVAGGPRGSRLPEPEASESSTLLVPSLLLLLAKGACGLAIAEGEYGPCGPELEEGKRGQRRPGPEEAMRLLLEENAGADKGERAWSEVEDGGVCVVSACCLLNSGWGPLMRAVVH